jgi:hypothetical protein
MKAKVRYVPDGASLVDPQGTDAAVYAYTTREGAPCAIAYHGYATRPDWHLTFKSKEEREWKIGNFIMARRTWAEIKAQRREKRKLPHPLQVGDIIVASWGCEQTNVDFYTVVGTTTCTVDLQPIASKMDHATPWASAMVVPVPENRVGAIIRRKRVAPDGAIRFASYKWGHKWDGNPKYESWYG